MNIIYKLTEQQIEQLHQLYHQEWWTNTRSLAQTKQGIAGSQICIGLTDADGYLQGFARVLTDYTFKALIFDLIIANKQRGKGLGEQLINLIKTHPKLTDVASFELYCLPELEDFYAKHDFTKDVGGIKLMRCVSNNT